MGSTLWQRSARQKCSRLLHIGGRSVTKQQYYSSHSGACVCQCECVRVRALTEVIRWIELVAAGQRDQNRRRKAVVSTDTLHRRHARETIVCVDTDQDQMRHATHYWHHRIVLAGP